jgi:acetyl esterase/lipase
MNYRVLLLLFLAGLLSSAGPHNGATAAPLQREADTPSAPEDEAKRPLEFRKFGAIEYAKGENYRLTLDVYVPEGDGPYPAVIAIHGGAWRSGTKINWIRHAWRLAGAGFVVVAINYRHAPEFRFPAQIHDCKSAVRWVRRNASQYRIDPDRIGALGYSAGGHLAALLATTDPDSGLEGPVSEEDLKISTRLSAVAIGGAPCDFDWVSDDSHQFDFFLGGTKREKPELWRAASPMTWLTADDPPCHFFHGENDALVPIEAARNMHDKLIALGVTSEFVVYDNGHFSLFTRLSSMDPVIEFFHRHMPESDKVRTRSP